MSNYVVDSLNYCINQLESIEKIKSNIQYTIDQMNNSLVSLNRDLDTNRNSKAYYGQAVDIIYQESIGALKNTINTALQYVFYDRTLEVDLILEDKRGNKTLDIVLNDLDKGIEGLDIKEDEGQGIAAVVSSILKTYLLLNKNSKILLLDEKYSNISAEYVERFFTFIRQLCVDKEFIIVMVTHDDKHTPYADYVYQAQNGNIIKVK